MPVEELVIASTSSGMGPIDFACIRRRFRAYTGNQAYIVVAKCTTSDAAIISEDDYWGTAKDWKVLNGQALSSEDIDEVAAYLLSTGQASM
jgi:hypothetical protein